ncbi:hypothetical protein EPA93_21470 [Ktedonosporobacter rubrisoli]|uniref:Uncharacterized protein n=1 Tax=Ktedonosporobacter rubrisoli TaxID=2509675 RepID=A0A4P6JSN7_KTERU|nr:hypothetical protein [Ktedonosporobacter rubrisoli]QBD78424.1 hypothetical protein EPA93_21470 [Ktedonosporobacter rubrisoli]
MKKQPVSRTYTISKVLGIVLLIIGCIWLARIFLSPHTGTEGAVKWRFPGLVPGAGSEDQIPALQAAGITLSSADQQPGLSQQQALLLADQLEADAAMKARNKTARYVLVSYSSTATPAAHTPLNDVPAWLIWYQQIPLQASDAEVDPTPSPQSSHDLYVFLDANSGKELLAVWV